MARYIDADLEVSNYVTVWDCDCSEFGKQTVMAVDDLHYLPTADVAPRAEVNEAYWEGVEYGNKDGAALVAREIFEEIEKHLFVIAPIEEFDGWARIQLADIMRLKKKYTEPEPPKGD